MTHVGYIVAGYGLTAAVLVGYILRLRSRGRALARYPTAPASTPDPAAGSPGQAGSPTP